MVALSDIISHSVGWKLPIDYNPDEYTIQKRQKASPYPTPALPPSPLAPRHALTNTPTRSILL